MSCPGVGRSIPCFENPPTQYLLYPFNDGLGRRDVQSLLPPVHGKLRYTQSLGKLFLAPPKLLASFL